MAFNVDGIDVETEEDRVKLTSAMGPAELGEQGTANLPMSDHSPWQLPPVSFRPSLWLPGAHGQTIFGSYLAAPELADARKIRVPLDDGDSIVLHEDKPIVTQPDRNGKPVVVLSIHGLGGCHRSGYVRRLAALAINAGWSSYRMDMRGAGESGRESEFLYHAGRSDDLLAAARKVRQLNPDATIVVCGFSLGASITLHLMAHWAREVDGLVSAAVAVAPPLDLKECADNLSNGWNRIYDRKFAKMLWQTLQERPNVLHRFESIIPKVAPQTLLDFDNQVTAPLGGYASADEYYRRFSTAPLLPSIQQPTLVITSRDDPLIPFHVFEAVAGATSVQLHATDKGGHLGFVSRLGKRHGSHANPGKIESKDTDRRLAVAGNRWLERAIVRAIGLRFCENWPE